MQLLASHPFFRAFRPMQGDRMSAAYRKRTAERGLIFVRSLTAERVVAEDHRLDCGLHLPDSGSFTCGIGASVNCTAESSMSLPVRNVQIPPPEKTGGRNADLTPFYRIYPFCFTPDAPCGIRRFVMRMAAGMPDSPLYPPRCTRRNDRTVHTKATGPTNRFYAHSTKSKTDTMKEFSEQPAGHIPYESPTVETLLIAVEQGFAQSNNGIEDPQKTEDNDFWG